MNYYYHPILGLQYTNIGDYFIIDIANIPQEFDVDYWLKHLFEKGVKFTDSVEKVLKITGYNLG